MENLKHLEPAIISKEEARRAASQAREHLKAIDAEESNVILGQAARRFYDDIDSYQ